MVPGSRAAILGKPNWRGLVQRGNLLSVPYDFSSVSWSKSSSTVTADAIVAPDGTLTADKIVEAAATAEHYAAQGSVAVTAAAHRASFLVKAGERSRFMLNLFGTTPTVSDKYAVFDLPSCSLTDAATGVSGSIRAVGGGWYLVNSVFVFLAASTVSVYAYPMTATTYAARSYAGDGTSGLYVWGGRLAPA